MSLETGDILTGQYWNFNEANWEKAFTARALFCDKWAMALFMWNGKKCKLNYSLLKYVILRQSKSTIFSKKELILGSLKVGKSFQKFTKDETDF